MKGFLFIAAFSLVTFFVSAQDLRPKVVVDGIEFKIAKCEGDIASKRVNVEFIFTNVGEFDRKVSFGQLLFTGPDGERFLPTGKYTAYLFENVKSTEELRSGVPARTRNIEIKDVSPRIQYFTEVSINQKFNVSRSQTGSDRRSMSIRSVPIVWK